jgi:putative oxidoreductase
MQANTPYAEVRGQWSESQLAHARILSELASQLLSIKNQESRVQGSAIRNPQFAIRNSQSAISNPLSAGLTGQGGKAQPAGMNALNRYVDPLYCILRLIIGLMFASHGGQKILGFPPGGHGAGEGSLLIGAWIELVGGLLIAFGLLTRIAAFISSGEMAVAYFMVHAAGKALDHSPAATEQFFPLLNKGEPAVLYCFIFLFIFFYGPGRYALDTLIFRRPPATAAAV